MESGYYVFVKIVAFFSEAFVVSGTCWESWVFHPTNPHDKSIIDPILHVRVLVSRYVTWWIYTNVLNDSKQDFRSRSLKFCSNFKTHSLKHHTTKSLETETIKS
jgi:hypothetical protein